MPDKSPHFLSAEEIRMQSENLRQKIAAHKQDADRKTDELDKREKELRAELHQIMLAKAGLCEERRKIEREISQLQLRCPTHNVVVNVQGEDIAVPLHNEAYECHDCGYIMNPGEARGLEIEWDH